ncbi:sulfur carrier protein ThiS [Alteromonas gracilis]|uniref:sulfur carrier protein ThiS n=1 Tax=Alteromonas gracilis TaxID=1479524 RepID=UPI0030D19B57
MTQIKISVNNDALDVIAPISLTELIALKTLDDKGTAIARNNTIVSKRQWSTTYLDDGDIVDIFTLVAGG